jgi:hypothetical protein
MTCDVNIIASLINIAIAIDSKLLEWNQLIVLCGADKVV